ncbi:MAG TPA: alpha/beta hydrolase [Micromonosporaceae bacterium]|nr:alpha/beta hydrolase [Micromonosporaceae bacterium]HCU52194.1 alpha/beta hydrolase [Micromonosporaceae bacterium]
MKTYTITIEGVPQRYHVAGAGPVCLVHSGGPGLGWQYLRMPAVEQHLTLVYLEPIGTGDSGRLADPREYNLDTYTRYLHGVVEHLDLPQVLLLGHSHGGFVAQKYALAHADRLSGLILYDTSPVTGADFWPDAMANLQLLKHRHPVRPEVASVIQALPEALATTDDEAFTEAFRRLFPAYFADYWRHEAELAPLRARVRAWIGPMRGEEPQPFDLRAELRSLTLPALILAGKYDFICGPRWAQLLHEAIHDSQLVTFTDSGHMAHLEQVAEFATTITQFADRLARDSGRTGARVAE